MELHHIKPYIRQAIVASLNQKIKTDVFNVLRTSDCRLFYIISGNGAMNIDAHEHPLTPGCLILFQSGTRYTWKIPDGVDLRYIAINFDYTQNHIHVTKKYHPVHADVFSDEDILETIAFSDASVLNAPIVVSNAVHLESMLQVLTSEYYFGNLYCQELLSSLLKTIIISIVRDVNEQRLSNQNKEMILARKALQYIQTHYSEDITNEDIANAIHFTPIYLNRIFKKHIGTSMHTFLVNYRLNTAKELLCSSNMPISSIAAMAGFTDMPHFSKAFKKFTGMTPSEFRNSNI